jgi:L-serine kinase (ATP) / ParB family transcriptional regulator, heme-responsive regulator
MNLQLPVLKFIEIEAILFHEKHDHQRTRPLIERIRESGFFRNPPIVAPLKDNSERYIVLDGANRVTALQEMGFPHVLVQVVESDHPGLNLENWNHVVWDMPPEEFLRKVKGIQEIDIDLSGQAKLISPDIWSDCGLALIQVPEGSKFTVCTPATDLERRVDLLHAVVDCYKDCCSLDRTSVQDISNLTGLYSTLSGLVIFPKFKIDELLRLASKGCLLPTGITRFTVSPRALHVNYPLYELAAEKPLDEKNANLQAWIQRRMAAKGVRYYSEATFLYDE